MSEPSPEEAIALVKTMMDHPVVKRMLDLDTWGHENGLDSAARAQIIKDMSTFYVACSDVNVGREYVKKAIDAVMPFSMSKIASLEHHRVSKSIREDACEKLVSDITSFFSSAKSMDVAVRYLKDGADIVADIGPHFVSTMRGSSE
jgi:hypothetical protein